MRPSLLAMETEALSRDIIRTIWWVIVIYVLGTFLNSFFTRYDQTDFLRDVTLIPALKMAVLWGAVEAYFRLVGRHLEYAAVIGVNLLVSIIILSLYELPIGVYLLIFPILISLFYLHRAMIVFTLCQGLITLFALYAFSANLQAVLTISNLMMAIAMIVGSAVVMNKLQNHVIKLARQLVDAMEEKQHLQIRNIQMEKISRIDPFTQLYNHKTFHEHLSHILGLAPSLSLPVHLALMDIDNFKRVNDTYGHAAGDEIIRFVADQIAGHLESDDFASRYGGEEFGIICVEKPTERFLEQLERLRQAIASVRHPALADQAVTVSIGVQRLLPGMRKEELFQAADSALYRAKKSGKNRIIHGEENGEPPNGSAIAP